MPVIRPATRRHLIRLGAPALAGALLLGACSSTSGGTTATSAPGGSTPGTATGGTTKGTTPATKGTTAGTTPASGEVSAAAVVATYADLVSKSYDASVASATKLHDAIHEFEEAPSEATLEAAKKQWLTARDDYGPTEAFRFYEGPIDNEDDGVEGQINAWPMDEAFVDYVAGAEPTGIINDATTYPEITRDVVIEANEDGGETNISTGWHAIEFLLWGQDTDPEGPGNRPVTDYTTDKDAKRRLEYLGILADLLVEDLEGVAEEWKPGADNYRKEFEAAPEESLGKMIRGIGALTAGELAGERMNVAYETKDQEDEHSCFSDNTNADVKNNALGIHRVYTADFPGVSGPSLSDLVKAKDAALDARIIEQLETTDTDIAAFPATFEKMITGEDGSPGRLAFKKVVDSLEAQGELIAEAATAVGVTVDFEV